MVWDLFGRDDRRLDLMNEKIIDNNVDYIKHSTYLRFMKKEKLKGGKRAGAGRKPSTDPKQPVTIFVETSIIESMGGKEGVQFLCYGAIYGEKKTGVVGPEFTAPQLPHPEPSFVATSPKRITKKDSNLTPKAKKEIRHIKIADLTAPASVLKPQEQPKTNYSIDTRPKTLDELKKLCPAELEGFDRSKWIATERQKYGI